MPPVLLVSLKRYIFTERGMEKIQKRISFQSTLRIPGKLMVAREQTAHYELVATCSHHGHGHGGENTQLSNPPETFLFHWYILSLYIWKHAFQIPLIHVGDHYTSNVKQPDGSWVHFDDSMLYSTKEKDVISDAPYLMLYMKINPARVPGRNTRE